jgi:polysaccharide export outer membrane protein
MTRIRIVSLVVLAACASSPSSAPEDAPMPAPATEASFKHDSAAGVWRYELKPGDVLRINVWRRPEFTGEFLVGPNGVLEHPLYQNVPVSNLPPDSVRMNVQAFLSRYETTPQFYVEPLFRILVGGEVHAPGLLNVPQSTTIPQAIALAGGPAQDAQMSNVILLRGHKQTSFDLTELGLVLDTLHVRSGDAIVVGQKINFLRNYAGPIASLVTMFIAIGYYTRR